MGKKRKSGGRSKGKRKGRAQTVNCTNCGAKVPRDKAEKVVRSHYPVDRSLAEELEEEGAIVRKQKRVKYYCVSCAVHYGVVRVGGR